MAELSKYRRKNMTPEDIAEHERDINEDGYELIEDDEHCGYTIELRQSIDKEELDQWHVWNDFDDTNCFFDKRDDAEGQIEDTKEEIDEHIEYYEEEDES